MDAARSQDRQAPTDPAGLSAYLLDREHDHWQSGYDHGLVTTPPEIMARAVYLATLTGPRPQAEVRDLLGQAHLGWNGDLDRLVADHSAFYPPTGPNRCWEPLRPDRLGEDFLALSSPGHAIADHQADDWVTTGLAALMALQAWTSTRTWIRPPRPWIRSAITVLVAAADRWEHLTTRHLVPLLRSEPQLGLAGGDEALVRLAGNPHVDADTFADIQARLPRVDAYRRLLDLDPRHQRRPAKERIDSDLVQLTELLQNLGRQDHARHAIALRSESLPPTDEPAHSPISPIEDEHALPPADTDRTQWRHAGSLYLASGVTHAALTADALALHAPVLAIAMGLVSVLSLLTGVLSLVRSPYTAIAVSGVARCWDKVAVLGVVLIAVGSLWTRVLSQPGEVFLALLLFAGGGIGASAAKASAEQATGRPRREASNA